MLRGAMEMFGNAGGISSLLSNADSHRLGHIVGSWIGTAPNQFYCSGSGPKLVGQDRINQLANRAGISSRIASAALGRILPMPVDKLTPHGKIPQAA